MEKSLQSPASSTPRTDTARAEHDRWRRYWNQYGHLDEVVEQAPPDADPFYIAGKLEGELKAWKDAVIEKLVVAHIYRKGHEDNPELAIADLIAWETEVALDPAVSAKAQALVDKGYSTGYYEGRDSGWYAGYHAGQVDFVERGREM